jgi:hypothetical protein
MAQNGRRLALVSVTDTTEAFCVRAALDVADHAALVVDAHGRVLVLNKPARAVFPQAKPGNLLSRLVPEAAAGAAWWDPGMSRCKKMHLTLTRRVYRVTATTVSLPGEEERLYVVAFVPAPGVAPVSPVANADRDPTIVRAVLGPRA